MLGEKLSNRQVSSKKVTQYQQLAHIQTKSKTWDFFAGTRFIIHACAGAVLELHLFGEMRASIIAEEQYADMTVGVFQQVGKKVGT